MITTSSKNDRGFSLIEVLVALVILSVGLMGVAALIVDSLRFGGSAILRTRAVNLAADMADRIRVNGGAGAAYEVAAAGTGTDGSCSESSTVATATSCTPAQLAAHDIFTWKNAIANAATGLPAGQGTIDHDGTTTPATYTIVVTWAERDEVSTYRVEFATP